MFDLAKMCAGRSQVFLLKMSSSRLSLTTRHTFYKIAILLLTCAAQRVASMSLERLGIDQNELKNDVEKLNVNNGDSLVVVDDMELESVPTRGNTDTYLLVPGSGFNERASVENNIIENEGGASIAETHPNEVADMLMVESSDTPLHLTLLGAPALHQESIETEEHLTDKNLEIPTESEKLEMVPVIVLDETDPQRSIEKDTSDNKVMLNSEKGYIADVIVDAVLELKKHNESKKRTPNSDSSENEKFGDKNIEEVVRDAENTSYNEKASEHFENNKIEQNVQTLPANYEAVKTYVKENQKKDEIIEQVVENEISKEIETKPIQNDEYIKFVSLENQDIKLEAEDNKVQREQVLNTNNNKESETLNKKMETEDLVSNEQKQTDYSDTVNANANISNEVQETAPEEVKAGENAMSENMEKDLAADIDEMIAEENGVEETIIKPQKLPKESIEKNDDKLETEDNTTETAEEVQPVTENLPAEDDQMSEESQISEETQAADESQVANAIHVTDGGNLSVNENPFYEDAAKQEESDQNKQSEEIQQLNEPSQENTIKEVVTIDEILPIGEVAEINTSEESSQDITLSMSNKKEEVQSDNTKQEETPLEIGEETNAGINEGIQESLQSENQQIMHEKLAEQSAEEHPETQNMEKQNQEHELQNHNLIEITELVAENQEEQQETLAEPQLVEQTVEEKVEETQSMEQQSQIVEPMPMKEQEQLEIQALEKQPQLNEEETEEADEKKGEQYESLQTQFQPETQKPAGIQTEEILAESPKKPTNSLLGTIITQKPQQQQQQQPITTPIKIESAQITTNIGVNNNPSITPAPQNIMDSVLNYVNASFLPFYNNNNNNYNNNKQETTQKQEDVNDNDLNAQLRRYDGAQVWRIVVQNDHDRKMADELQTKYGGQLWKEVKQEVDYLLKPQVLNEAAQHVRAANLSRIVLIENLQNAIETENPTEAEIATFQNRKGHRLTWIAYHRLADIHGYFDYMAKTYPDICSVETIGYSLEKRPLKILKISNGNASNPGIWIDGGMHAREWISPATVTFIANQLVEGWDDLPEYMRNIDWYIHAVANPDGYEYTHTTDRLWRKNMRSHGRQCPGVDLNRNFGYKWGGKGTSANPCSPTYRGSKAFSEPETFYISKFISNYPRNTFQAYLSFHSYGKYILYPWGYDYLLTADQMDLDRVARQAGTTITKKSGGKYTVGASATTLYPAAGGSDDWAKGFAGIKYSYTIEMGDTGRYGFVLPASHIEPNGRDGYTFVEIVARAIEQDKRSSRRWMSRKRGF